MTEQRDYRDTVFLPKTDFPMKAGLPQKEPGILARWQAEGLYQQVRASARRAREVHPPRRPALRQRRHAHRPRAQPHAQGHGRAHADACSARTRPTCPGGTATACRSSGRSRSSTARRSSTRTRCPVEEFRAECRAYAQHWVDVQREQLKRLGIDGDWDNPYLTMDFEAEATIVARAAQVRRERPALSRRQAGDVVARSRRPRWPRPRSSTRTSSRPRSTWRSRSSRARSPSWSARTR